MFDEIDVKPKFLLWNISVLPKKSNLPDLLYNYTIQLY